MGLVRTPLQGDAFLERRRREILDRGQTAVAEFVEQYNQSWRLEKLGYQTPIEVRERYELRHAA